MVKGLRLVCFYLVLSILKKVLKKMVIIDLQLRLSCRQLHLFRRPFVCL